MKTAKPPALTSPPERMGENVSGALPCAFGSQTWNGKTPSLTRPAMPIVMKATMAFVGSPVAAANASAITNVPVRLCRKSTPNSIDSEPMAENA